MARKQSPRGLGSIYRTDHGVWVGKVSGGYDKDTGKRIRKTVTASTQQALLDKMDAVRRQVSAGKLSYTSSVPLGQFLHEWLEDIVRVSLRPKTYDSYLWCVEHYVDTEPGLASTALNAVTPMQLQRFFNGIVSRHGASGSTANSVRSVLSGAFKHAKRLRLVNENPVTDTVRQVVSKEEFQPYSMEEMRRFMSAAGGHEFGAAFVLMATTGIRPGECLGLYDADVDLENGVLKIQRTLTYVRRQGLREGPPKSNRGRRSIAIPDVIVPVLEGWLENRAAMQVSARRGRWVETPYFFVSSAGTPLWPTSFEDKAQRVVRDAGLTWKRIHGLRHFFATQQAMAGENPSVVQRQLGHSRVNVTLDYYTHVEAVGRESMNRVANQIFAER